MQNFIFSLSGGWKSEMRNTTWLTSGEGSLPGMQLPFLFMLFPHDGNRTWSLSPSFDKVTALLD
jgi:hypothetical protein